MPIHYARENDDSGTRLHPASRDGVRLWLPVLVGFAAYIGLSVLGVKVDGRSLARDQQVSQMATLVLIGVPFLAATWWFIARASTSQWRAWAQRERGRSKAVRMLLGQSSILLVVVFLAGYGLLAAVLLLRAEGETATAVLATAGVVVTWAMLQTSYVLYYAYAYEREGGGLRFPGQDDAPTLFDFAYFTFAVGTTFAASDVEVTSSRIRRVVMAHGLSSFAFNTVLIALVINGIAS